LSIKTIAFLLFAFVSFSFSGAVHHPVFVSVTEIEYNEADKSLEVVCKIFTNDFENTLRKGYPKQKIDLLAAAQKKQMEKTVADYLSKHLKIAVDGKSKSMEFLGFEQQEESIASYLQIGGVERFKNITVKDDILYEFKAEQISLIHITVMGKRKSTKLNNPDAVAVFEY
jgi:hypothetical protein